jgi:hypothetical protein
MVKRDRTANSNFEAGWLKARKATQAEEGAGLTKHKHTQIAATSELQRKNKEVVRCRKTTTIGTNNGEAYPADQLIT